MAISLTKRTFNGLKAHLWATFAGFTIVIFLVLIAFQIIFFNRFYESMKGTELTNLSKSVISLYANSLDDGYEEELDELALTNNLYIVIYIFDGVVFDVIYIPKTLSPLPSDVINTDNISIELRLVYDHVNSSRRGYVVFKDDSIYPKGILIYGSKLTIDGKEVYFYVNSPLEGTNIAYRININVLLITTLASILVGIAVSFFVSNRLSKPIVSLNSVAKELSKGNFNIVFPDTGFTEIKELGETLNLAKNEMQITTQLQRELIANISHDIRTPLTLIKSYAEMIKDISGETKEKREEHLDVIINETDRLSSLVDDVMQLSKIQSQAEELHLEMTCISDVCLEIIEHFAVAFKQNKITVINKIEQDIEVLVDKAKMKQVIYNFLSNAITYTKSKITISLQQRDGIVRFDCIDNGGGIKAEELTRIWERYYRSKDNHLRTKAGSGLGLSIVKAILDAHGLKYGVNSKENEGADFYFEI